MEYKILDSIAYILPSIVTGLVAYYMFKGFIKNKDSENKLEILSQKMKESLPLKLKAYERMLLFSDRINPVKMLLRINPLSDNKQDYLQLLVANVEQEFEHNLVQQIYVSNEAWIAVLGVKNTVINKLILEAKNSSEANDLRENIFKYYSNKLPPTDTAIAIIKNEVKKIL